MSPRSIDGNAEDRAMRANIEMGHGGPDGRAQRDMAGIIALYLCFGVSEKHPILLTRQEAAIFLPGLGQLHTA